MHVERLKYIIWSADRARAISASNTPATILLAYSVAAESESIIPFLAARPLTSVKYLPEGPSGITF